MGYRYYKKKRENKRIEAIVYLIFIALFLIYYYRESILKILIVIIGITSIITILYFIFRKKYNEKPITKENELNEKRKKIQKYYELDKQEEKDNQPLIIKREIPPFQGIIKEKIEIQKTNDESLHVNQNIQNMEKQFFNQLSRKRPSYQENKKRGNDYEIYVGKYYEKQGYKVLYHGLKYGKKDGGIDLIAENENETLLIQCKAWQTAEIKQKHLKEFIGNCTIFLEDNPINKKIKRVFITSSEKSELGLNKYLIQHTGKIEYIIMPF